MHNKTIRKFSEIEYRQLLKNKSTKVTVPDGIINTLVDSVKNRLNTLETIEIMDPVFISDTGILLGGFVFLSVAGILEEKEVLCFVNEGWTEDEFYKLPALYVKTWITQICPTTSKELLLHNKRNYRNSADSTTDSYAEQMKAGKWELNGETIVFDKEGDMRNGQHRTKGNVKSDSTVNVMIVTGVEPTNTFDYNRGRTVENALKAEGYTNLTHVAAVSKIMICGISRSRGPYRCCLDYAEAYIREIQTARKMAIVGKEICPTCKQQKKKLSDKAPIIAVVYSMNVLELMPEEEIRAFFKIFNSGIVTSKCPYEFGPALVARECIRNVKGGGEYPQMYCASIVYQALMAFHKGIAVKTFKEDDKEVKSLFTRAANYQKEHAAGEAA